MSNETTSSSLSVLITNKKAKGTYRVYKSKKPKKKK
jgi:hypothetical protein